jgi:lipopolysaccharide biosynthesis regulator YciM
MTSSVWDFLLIFFISFFILVIIVVTLVFRAKPAIDQQEEAKKKQDIDQEKIIVKEIIKIRCRYCGFTYDQGLDSCPNCGART